MNYDISPAAIQSQLSLERTILANHRTLLAYIRSAVGLIVAGAGLLKFIQSPAWIIIGIICIVLTPIILFVGIMDYRRVNKIILRERKLVEQGLIMNAEEDEDSD